jgi:hypothetical protein
MIVDQQSIIIYSLVMVIAGIVAIIIQNKYDK